MEKEQIIRYIVDQYEENKADAKAALSLGIMYRSANRTLYIEIDGERHALPFNNLSDSPDVGDKKAESIKMWAHHVSQ